MVDVILDTLIDSLKLLPFLFFAFLLIELFEHKFSDKSKKVIEKSGKFGPVIGSLFGIIPQCGFSVAATNLYATRIITLGTLFSVYLATSDEMIPLLIAEQAPLSLMIKVLLIKFIIGLIFGFIIDLILRKKEKPDYHICDHEHCHCEKGVLNATIRHTVNIFIFILIFTFIINVIMFYLGNNFLENIFLKDNIFSSFITGLIGLIPNCASSVILTELYLNSSITFGALLGGLLSAAGVGLLVLFKENNKKESIKIVITLYCISAICGLIIDLIV